LKLLYIFIVGMWTLILTGGGIVVTILGPVSITGYGDLNLLLSSIIKGIIAVILVIIWITILIKMKNLIFRKIVN